MECYYHKSETAVTICRECGKALCQSCYEEEIDGLCPSCSNRPNIDTYKEKANIDLIFLITFAVIFSIGTTLGMMIISNFNIHYFTSFGKILSSLIVSATVGYLFYSFYFGIKTIDSFTRSIFPVRTYKFHIREGDSVYSHYFLYKIGTAGLKTLIGMMVVIPVVTFVFLRYVYYRYRINKITKELSSF